MNVTITIIPGSLEAMRSAVGKAYEAVRPTVIEAMTHAFHTIVLNNFGSSGPMRPLGWQKLSPKYAKKVGRDFATLYVTGQLKETVKADASNPECGIVSMGNTAAVPYAMAHHHGNPGNFGWTQPGSGDLPARRVFPLDMVNDEVTPEAKKVVVQAAQQAVQGAFR